VVKGIIVKYEHIISYKMQKGKNGGREGGRERLKRGVLREQELLVLSIDMIIL